ncbi:MAG: arginine--tRNA ligase [Candidatus Cloacimonetes bacterium]|jgi:arginyl-tRNA synthetase|nr:arginine--tRNA ligase [Candidatus Cloacimonadota bacterium]MBT6994946.1 arginine--tRNA ligase [Candidatus Cloacimonadota bacterium]MBT7469523.1 arginine--tRNA ligase [Candidatus Cloacimonadota bacterium]
MIKSKIFDDLIEVLEELDLEYTENFSVEIPNNVEHGDFSSNVALLNAKLNKMAPRDLAEKFVEIFAKKRYYKKVEIAGPGFINFKLANSVFHKNLIDIVEKKKKFAASKHGKKQRILLEFISANPTGPLNVVSARAGAFGDTLASIMRHVGYDVFTEFYVNDAGNQVDILAESLELRYRELHGERIDEFPPEAYHGEYLKDLASQLNSAEGSKLFHCTENDRMEKMRNFALKKIQAMQYESLERFGVHFNNWMSERKLRKDGILEEALSYLAEAGCTYEKDEAIWFNSSQFGDIKDRVLIKADGNPTYLVPDIAYHITKYNRAYDVLIDVLGPDHHGHISKLRAAMKALELDASKLEVVYLQHINLIQNGEVVKMSKRAGRIVTLNDLIDEVGKDAARYFFIDRKPSAHLDFDMELAKKQSSENPVFYCQYAYARINSIMKKAKKAKISLKDFDTKNLRKLNKDEELRLIKKMLELKSILIGAAEHREPHRLSGYLHELAGMFHKYYAKYHIIDEKRIEMTQARLYLCSAVKNVIGLALDLMGISTPQKM